MNFSSGSAVYDVMNYSFKALAGAYIAVLLAFACLDGVWLGVIAMPLYQSAFDTLLRDQFITWPWLAFYLLYCAAVVYLAIRPYAAQNLLSQSLAGIALGATAYGTYNLTCYSIIDGWPLAMTFVDWIWGTTATGIIATSGGWAARKI